MAFPQRQSSGRLGKGSKLIEDSPPPTSSFSSPFFFSAFLDPFLDLAFFLSFLEDFLSFFFLDLPLLFFDPLALDFGEALETFFFGLALPTVEFDFLAVEATFLAAATTLLARIGGISIFEEPISSI